MNTTRNAVTGIAPSELMYGKMVDLDEGILLPRMERPQFESLSESIFRNETHSRRVMEQVERVMTRVG